jgi:hypothetical protein
MPDLPRLHGALVNLRVILGVLYSSTGLKLKLGQPVIRPGFASKTSFSSKSLNDFLYRIAIF